VLQLFEQHVKLLMLFEQHHRRIKVSTRKLCSRKDDHAMRTGCPEVLGLPDYAHGYYSQHFSWSFVLIDPVNVPTKFEVRSFTRS